MGEATQSIRRDVASTALSIIESFALVDNDTAINDTGDGLPSNTESLALTRFIVQKVLVPVVVCLGVLGNVLNMVILTRRSMKSSTNCYLTALAAFDTLYLVFSLTLSFKHYSTFSRIPSYVYWYPYGRVFTDMSANVSVLLTVTFTVERYIGVCLPMKGRILCTVQRAKVIIAVVVAAAIMCTVPELFEMTVVEKTVDNVSFPVADYTEFSLSYGYKMGYYWFFVTVFTFIPLILLCVFNGILIQSVFNAVKIRRQMTLTSPSNNAHRSPRYAGEQQKITKMLITVVLVFLLCQIPGAVLLLYWSYVDLAAVKLPVKIKNDLKIAGNCTNLLVQINASINFILYSLISTKFRRVFCHVVCKTTKAKRVNGMSKNSEYTAVHTAGSVNMQSFKLHHLHYHCHNGV
ncbi:FMRFamide receptor-like [Gigantopelta aegis]|uniref:FMRFamide receptor-like n=1 Tax=Gigantopelta aegis TaxID=1735272 RepID=UPI001B8883C4|nr:FMRFamide receptor-like [Gigantopelta aegis]